MENQSIFTWLFGDRGDKQESVKVGSRISYDYRHILDITQLCVQSSLDALDKETSEGAILGYGGDENGIFADMLLSICRRISELIVDLGGADFVDKSKLPAQLIALSEGMKEICAFTHTKIANSSVLIANNDLMSRVSGSKLACIVREANSGMNTSGDQIVERVSECLESCFE